MLRYIGRDLPKMVKEKTQKLSRWLEKRQLYIFVALAAAIAGGGVVALVATRELKPEITIIQPTGEVAGLKEEEPPAAATPSAEVEKSSPSPSPAPQSASPRSSKVNLNTAAKSRLESLPHIGPVKAQAIIDYRRQRPFGSIGEITRVKGIGPKTLEKIKDLITVE